VLHGSEIWPARKENEVALQQAERGIIEFQARSLKKD